MTFVRAPLVGGPPLWRTSIEIFIVASQTLQRGHVGNRDAPLCHLRKEELAAGAQAIDG